jgi:integral membrane protein (TIGR00529 family)
LSALVKLALVFAGIVLLIGRKWNLGLVLLLASVAVGLLFAHPLPQIGADVLLAIVDPLTLRLAGVVVLIMVLGELLRQSAGLKGMVEALQALIPNGRIVIAALPALVGLLPMVGGAMLSAPMVNEVGDRLGADGGRKTFVNYWFRHLWELIFPVYPSVLMAMTLLGLTAAQLASASWPLVVAAVTGGLLFGLLGLPRNGPQDPDPSPRIQDLRILATSTWPVVLVIALSLTLPVDERFSLVLSLVVTITLMMAVKRIPVQDLGTILRERIPWESVAVIFGALIFRRVLQESSAVVAVSDALTRLHIPLPVVAFGVPFTAALLTGLIVAGFSIGIPVILPLLIRDGGMITPAWTALVLTGGFLGAMLSPVHLCLALSRVYFEAGWGPIYRRIAPAALLLITTAATMLLLT